jgi:hypothetical protein
VPTLVHDAPRRRLVRDARVLARLLAPYLVFAALKRLVSLPRLARWAWRCPVPHRDRSTEEAVGRVVVRLRNRFGWDRGDCLQGSLAMYRVLSRAGANPTLVVGVRRSTSGEPDRAGSPRRVTGHAWIEVDGEAVGEQPPETRGFARMASFGRAGAAVPPAGPAGPRPT